jgi:hypothetical protein
LALRPASGYHISLCGRRRGHLFVRCRLVNFTAGLVEGKRPSPPVMEILQSGRVRHIQKHRSMVVLEDVLQMPK